MPQRGVHVTTSAESGRDGRHVNRPDVWLVRHGETEWSRDGRHTSRTDLPLTAKGEAEARALVDVLAGVAFDLVLVSPRDRAIVTAKLAGHPAAIPEPDLVEWDYGEYEGLTTPEIREQRPGWYLWRDGNPGGEVAAQVGERADRVIERALAALPEGDVAMFAHGHLLRVLGARWIELGAECGGLLALDTAALCELGFEREQRVLWLWNG
jgi:broad specificity phosphatase PhoE